MQELIDTQKIYDVIIVGAGPAGISASIYASRSGLRVALIEKGLYGGTLHDTLEVENYVSYDSISGEELAEKMEKHVEKQENIDHIYGNVGKLSKIGDVFEVNIEDTVVLGKSVVIATGVKYKKMNIELEDWYQGKGISNCAVCDMGFFKDDHVAVIGGGDSAVESALYASNIAKKVTLIHRRNKLRADEISQLKLFSLENVEIIWDAETVGFLGELDYLTGLKYIDKQSGDVKEINVDGAFVNIGVVPVTEPFSDWKILDDEGYVLTNSRMETSVDGLYAIGDVRSESIRQIVNATADGAMVSESVNKYLSRV